MKTIDFSYFIERYNAGEMDEAEKEWFGKELQKNEKLRKEVELRSRTDDVLKNHDMMNLRNKLNAIEKQRREPVPLKKPGRALNTRYAAAIAGLVIIGSIILLSSRKMSNDEILSKYYKPYELVSTSRSDEAGSAPDYYKLAVEFYNIHDYRNAARYFSMVLESDPENMQTELLNGISNFENQDYPAAKGSFFRVISDNNNFYIDHAQWYLALCYIKTGQTEKARKQLITIKTGEGILVHSKRQITESIHK